MLSARLAELGCAVVGVDAGPDMVRSACARGVDARVMDGHSLDFAAEFDAVFSNAALHWMRADPEAVISGVARALRPGGRFVGEMGGHGNVAAITVALIAALNRRGLDGARAIPWYFPTPGEYRCRLERRLRRCEYRAVAAPDTAADRLGGGSETFAEPFLRRVPEAEQVAIKAEVVDLLQPVLRDQAGRWTADYVRLRFAANLQRGER